LPTMCSRAMMRGAPNLAGGVASAHFSSRTKRG
jgi:hypothetical protein